MRGFLALFGLEPCGLQFSLCYVEIADVQCSSWFQRYLWKVEKALKSRSKSTQHTVFENRPKSRINRASEASNRTKNWLKMAKFKCDILSNFQTL